MPAPAQSALNIAAGCRLWRGILNARAAGALSASEAYTRITVSGRNGTVSARLRLLYAGRPSPSGGPNPGRTMLASGSATRPSEAREIPSRGVMLRNLAGMHTIYLPLFGIID